MSQTFKNLRVYQIAIDLSAEIYKLALKLPASEKYRVADQIIRSSRSVPTNIAEGYSRKKYKVDFIRYLTIAHGSSEETKVHLEILRNSKLIPFEVYSDLLRRYKNLSVRIINYKKKIQEDIS